MVNSPIFLGGLGAAMRPPSGLLTSGELAELAGVPARRIQDWALYGLMRPRRGAQGGKWRRWRPEQVFHAALIYALERRGFRRAYIRAARLRRIVRGIEREGYRFLVIGDGGRARAYGCTSAASAIWSAARHPGAVYLIDLKEIS
jgi:MerR-like DNA binding protein